MWEASIEEVYAGKQITQRSLGYYTIMEIKWNIS